MADRHHLAFTCGICYEDFDTHARKPLALPCQHNYCAVCLGLLLSTGRTPRCPSCNENLPRGTTLASLRPNYGLIHAMEEKVSGRVLRSLDQPWSRRASQEP